jgi:hypothetical protein
MAVMVRFTLKTDAQTYQQIHGQFVPLAASKGLLFHAAHEAGSQVGVIDFWPSADAFQSFFDGPATEGLNAAGIALPDDIEITPVLNATSG